MCIRDREYTLACKITKKFVDFNCRLSDNPSFFTVRILLSAMYQHIDKNNAPYILNLLSQIFNGDFPKNLQVIIHAMQIWSHLLMHNLELAGVVFDNYSVEYLTTPSSILFLLYGLYLWIREGKEIALIQFDILPDVAFPYTYELLAYYLFNKLYNKNRWEYRSFIWERVCLYKQLSLFYSIQNDMIKTIYYEKKIKTLWKHQKIR